MMIQFCKDGYTAPVKSIIGNSTTIKRFRREIWMSGSHLDIIAESVVARLRNMVLNAKHEGETTVRDNGLFFGRQNNYIIQQI